MNITGVDIAHRHLADGYYNVHRWRMRIVTVAENGEKERPRTMVTVVAMMVMVVVVAATVAQLRGQTDAAAAGYKKPAREKYGFQRGYFQSSFIKYRQHRQRRVDIT